MTEEDIDARSEYCFKDALRLTADKAPRDPDEHLEVRRTRPICVTSGTLVKRQIIKKPWRLRCLESSKLGSRHNSEELLEMTWIGQHRLV
jgi:hypothetical protein